MGTFVLLQDTKIQEMRQKFWEPLPVPRGADALNPWLCHHLVAAEGLCLVLSPEFTGRVVYLRHHRKALRLAHGAPWGR